MRKDISSFCTASLTVTVYLRSQFLIKGNVNATKQTQPISNKNHKLFQFTAISASAFSKEPTALSTKQQQAIYLLWHNFVLFHQTN